MKTKLFRIAMWSMACLSIVMNSCIIEDDGVPIVPANVQVTISNKNPEWVNVKWDDDGFDETGLHEYFIIERAITIDGDFKQLGNTIFNSFTDTINDYNTTYYYRVKSYSIYTFALEDPIEYSDYSEVVAFETGEQFPKADNIRIIASTEGYGDNAIFKYYSISWDVIDASTLDHFEIYKNGSLLVIIEATENILEYNYKDENMKFNTNYSYSIKTVSTDGTIHRSPEIPTIEKQ